MVGVGPVVGPALGVHEMTRYVLSAAILGLAFAAAPAARKPSLETPKTREDFDKIVEALKPQAKAFAEARDDRAPTVSDVVKKLQYMPDSTIALSKALQGRYGKPMEQAYVVYQLTQPLKMVGDNTLRRVKPALVRLLKQHSTYKELPHWPAGTLRRLVPPANLPAEKLAKEMPKLQKVRQEKLAAERPTVKHNRLVDALEVTLKTLLIMVGDRQVDDLLLERLVKEEANRLATCFTTLAVIKNHALKMKQDQAKIYYKALRELADRVGPVKKHYVYPTRPQYSLTGNSGFESAHSYFIITALETVNLVATAAKEPAVNVPTAKALDKLPRR
jgi:hypothetical protein